MSGIGPSRLDARRSDSDVFVLDVRPEAQYREGRIPGGSNTPVYRELRGGNPDALDAHLNVVPDDAEIVTVCKAGIVARRATEYPEDAGYSATTLTGGHSGWRQYEGKTLPYRIASFLQPVVGRHRE
ncbi:MAG: rhodanese-like domain-containing protein [Halorientalis sp.]